MSPSPGASVSDENPGSDDNLDVPPELDGQTPTTAELRMLQAEAGDQSAPLKSPSVPVQLIPRNNQEPQDNNGEDLDELADQEIDSEPSLENLLGDSEVSKPEADARALTDKLLEMADLPKDDDVPDNTKLKPVVWNNPSFLVRIVTGAPGDGNESLTSSIKAALRSNDMTVTEDPRQAAYEIRGRVVVGPAVNGRQQTRIVWRVNTIDGDEVGQAIQENTVIAGSLDGEWGRVAAIVSEAAVSGIAELFDGRGRRRNAAGSVAFPDAPPLPQVPGRAPPPGG
jgi:hypothetical protein